MRRDAPRIILPVLFVLIAAGCSHGARSGLPPTGSSPQMLTPESVSPALIAPAPMAKTAPLPASAMQSSVRSASAIAGPNWSQIPGSASQVAAAPDGSMWVLSTLPAGPDKYIWHYANGAWSNVSGLAAHLAVAPDGTLYAVNSGGGTYSYKIADGNWNGLGGGASAISVAADGSIYVLSSGGTAADKAIWHNVAGNWSQAGGSGISLAANWDVGGPYSPGNGTLRPGGLYILNSVGAIWYENADGSFAQLPGNASALVPAPNGGVFVLGYPGDSNGSNIYYYDLRAPGWSQHPGVAVSISADTNLYAVTASGAIYSSPITPAGSSLPVRGLWVQFDRRGWHSGYWNGDALQQFTQFDGVVNGTVNSEIALQMDKMRVMGVNTIELEIRAADISAGSSFTPPECAINPVLGVQYPQPTATELTNLAAFFDLASSKGMKIVLNLVNTHMEEQPPVNNTTWLRSILQAVENQPALYLVSFDGDVHVNNFNNVQSCGIPAEPPLWLGSNAPPAQYVKWAIGYANSLGLPFSKLTAESVVGSYIDENSSNLYSPINVMKGIYDSLGVPDNQRTYGVSFYEHRKCLYATWQACVDEAAQPWAEETMQYIFATIGRTGAHAVAIEYGYATPVNAALSTADATDNLLSLMEQDGMDGGCYWRWISYDNSEDADPTLADPVKRRGVSFQYTPVQAVLAKHYTAP